MDHYIGCSRENIVEGRCLDCEAKDRHPIIQGIDRTTKSGSCTLIGYFSDNAERLLFSYYIDEHSFSDAELIGLTEEQAHELFRNRDVAYLRS